MIEAIKEKTPSERAWDTARQKAVADYEARFHENRIKGEIERQEMIRALTDKSLSHGASRLFCLLLKAGWMKEFGGLFKEQVGSIYIDGRRLAKLCGGASVNCLYRKIRKEKRDPKTNKLLRAQSETLGWIEELVRGGYVWVSKQRIPNIPPAKWPNVYHCSCHVPQQITPSLPWVDGPLPSANVVMEGCSPAENRDFDASDAAGDTESPENTQGNHRNGGQPVTAWDNRQSPKRIIANHRNGGQPITEADNRQSPHGITGNHRNGGQPVTESPNGQPSHPVQLRESLDKKPPLNEETCVRPEPHSPMPRFEPLDQKMVIRLRQKFGPDMIERLKSKVGRMEMSRKPLPNQKEIIAAYKQRIRDIKDWMDGEIPEKRTAAGTAAH